MRQVFASLLVALCFVVATGSSAFSQSWPAGVTPVMGVVTNVSSNTVVVEGPGGAVTVHLSQPMTVYAPMDCDLTHVGSNTFVGVTSVKQPDGSERATEVHIFPEELRGVGEGSYPMAATPSQTAPNRMTNGSVSTSRMTNGVSSTSRMTNGAVSAKGSGASLTVRYNGGTQVISVPKDTPVTMLAPTKEVIRQGQSVLVLAKKQQDSSFTSGSILLLQPAK